MGGKQDSSSHVELPFNQDVDIRPRERLWKVHHSLILCIYLPLLETEYIQRVFDDASLAPQIIQEMKGKTNARTVD